VTAAAEAAAAGKREKENEKRVLEDERERKEESKKTVKARETLRGRRARQIYLLSPGIASAWLQGTIKERGALRSFE
jgi:hypothetical protein